MPTLYYISLRLSQLSWPAVECRSRMPADEPPSETLAVKPGDLIAGKYRVERLLAAGGMGSVVKARHEVLHQDVAIKLMRRDLADSDMARKRFLREARAAAKIASDYVARVTDVDVLPDGTPLMVMEFLEGEELHDIMKRERRLPVTRAVDLMVQALFGLSAAHDLGVVHRDLKPSNLFVTKTSSGKRRVKLLDFGISKVLEAAASEGLRAGANTGIHSSLGTPRYMSPEQIRSAKDVDERTDLWSVGLILYQTVTGTFPFKGDTLGEVLSDVMTVTVPRMSSIAPEVPGELSDVVDRCLQRDRDDRYNSARELMQALAPFASARIQASLAPASTRNPPPDVEIPPSLSGPTLRLDEDSQATVIDTGEDTEVSPPEAPASPAADAPTTPTPQATANTMTIEDTWTDRSGRLWLFGGLGILAIALVGGASVVLSPEPAAPSEPAEPSGEKPDASASEASPPIRTATAAPAASPSSPASAVPEPGTSDTARPGASAPPTRLPPPPAAPPPSSPTPPPEPEDDDIFGERE